MANVGAADQTRGQMTETQKMIACEYCGLIQSVDSIPRKEIAKCARCRLVVQRRKPDSLKRTLALVLAALLLYFPANLIPILRAEYHGARTQTRLFDGIQSLFQKGNYVVGCLVLTTSIVAPGFKLVGLALLCASARLGRGQKFRTRVYRTVQMIDPWSMLPVTLLALVVSLVELGKVAAVQPGPGLFAFAGMVGLTSWASLTFDPRIIWNREDLPQGD